MGRKGFWLRVTLLVLGLWSLSLPKVYAQSMQVSVPATATVGAPGFSITVRLFDGAGNPFTPSCTPSCPTVTIAKTLPGRGTLLFGSASLTGATTIISGEQYTSADTIQLQLNANIGVPVGVLSSAITFSPGPYQKTLLLLPGETYSFTSVTGKTGSPTAQVINSAFNIQVQSLDAFNNLVTVNGGNATLTTSPPTGMLTGTTSKGYTNGVASFSVSISTYWYNLSIAANDNVTPGITGQTDQVTSYGTGYHFNVIVPGPVTAGGPATFPVTVELRDSANGNILVDNGAIPSPAPNMTFTFSGTGTSGVANASYNQNPFVVPNESYTQSNASTNLTVSAAIVPGRANITGSTSFVVNPGPYFRTQILLPGETAVPGVPSATGKVGAIQNYVVNQNLHIVNTPINPFITVRAVDQYWNLVTGTGASAKLDTNPSGFITGTNTVAYDGSGIASFSNVRVSTTGAAVGIVASDSVNGAIFTQADSITIFPEPPIYKVIPPSIATMTPATFQLQVVLIGSISGSTITFANNSFNLVTVPIQPITAGSFTLGTIAGSLVGGIATIPTETVSRTGTLQITASDVDPQYNTAPDSFRATSPIFSVVPEDHHYVATTPTGAIFGVPFPLTITRIDNGTGLPVTRSRNIQLTASYTPAYGGTPIALPATITPSSVFLNAGSTAYNITFNDPQPLVTHSQIYFTIYPQFDGDNSPTNPTTPLATLSTTSTVVDISTGPAGNLTLSVKIPFVVGSTTAIVTAELTDTPEGHRIPGEAINFSLTQGVGTLNAASVVTDALGHADVQISVPSAVGQGQIYIVKATYGSFTQTIQVTLALPPLTQLTTTGPALTSSDGILHIKTNTDITLTGISVVTISSVTRNVDFGGNIVALSSSTTFNLPAGRHTLQYFSTDLIGQNGPRTTVIVEVAGGGIPTTDQLINYPNPFRAGSESTIFEYNLAASSDVRFRIFTLMGKLVLDRTLRQGDAGTALGFNQLTWDGKNGSSTTVANGGYVAIIEVAQTGTKLVRKVAVVK